jgi:hypothetical protein
LNSSHDTTNGSLFVKALCDELIKNGTSDNILEILTSVKQSLQKVPTVSYSLTKKLVFKKK